MENEFLDVQNKQQEIINQDFNILRSNLTATTQKLANKIDIFDQKLNFTQEKQHGNKQHIDQLTSKIENITNDIKLIDQQIETVQQKQIEFGNGNDQKINVLRTNHTDAMHRLDE